MDGADEEWLDFLNDIDGARYVKVVRLFDTDTDPEHIIGVLVWYGGHTVQFFDNNLDEDVYNIGDFSKNEVPFEVAKKEIEEIADYIIDKRHESVSW